MAWLLAPRIRKQCHTGSLRKLNFLRQDLSPKDQDGAEQNVSVSGKLASTRKGERKGLDDTCFPFRLFPLATCTASWSVSGEVRKCRLGEVSIPGNQRGVRKCSPINRNLND